MVTEVRPAKEITKANPRAWIDAWVTNAIATEPEFQIPRLAERLRMVIMHDADMMTRFVDQQLLEIITLRVRSAVRLSRGALVQAGDTVSDRELFRASAVSKWRKWAEHVGDHHVKLVEMKQSDLLTAAAERRTRGETELFIAELWERMAKQMNAEQTVGERFTAEQIAALENSIRKEKEAA